MLLAILQIKSIRRHSFSSDDSDRITEESQSADSYSDDFEDYSDDFDEDESSTFDAQASDAGTSGSTQVTSDREAMMRNLRRMNSSQEDTPPSNALEETVSSKVSVPNLQFCVFHETPIPAYTVV